MPDFEQKNTHALRIKERTLSVMVFSLFFGWILSFPFEGQILYSLSDQYQIDADNMIFSAIAATLLGLFSGGYFADNIRKAKQMLLLSIVLCGAATVVFFFPPTILWEIFIVVGAYSGGIAVALWGYFFKNGTPPNQRIKTAAAGLIFSNISMIGLNMIAIHISPRLGLGVSLLLLAATFWLCLYLPETEKIWNPYCEKSERTPHVERPLLMLCAFIIVITINSGLMYQVINPAYEQYEWLVSWYWAIPYIVALYIMKSLPRTANRTYILYVGIAMIGFAFLFFMNMDHTVGSYFLVDTLMLGACGIYDLFWWSILGEMLDWGRNPAKILGMGLSANVTGILLGGLIGNGITSNDISSEAASMIAIAVVFVTLLILPVLHGHLTTVLKDHAYLTVLSGLSPTEHQNAIAAFALHEKLTEREREITALLLEGKTNRMIATELFLSENTIKTHVKNIYSKLKVQSRMELVGLMLDLQPEKNIQK